MKKIQKISRYLSWIFKSLLILLPITLILLPFIIHLPFMASICAVNQTYTPEGTLPLHSIPWTPLSKIIYVSGLFVEELPLYGALFILKALCRRYQQGEIFSLNNALAYQYLSYLFLVSSLITQPFGNLLRILGATLTNPPGHRYLTLSFGSLNLSALIGALLLMLLSWIMVEASRLKEEEQLTI